VSRVFIGYSSETNSWNGFERSTPERKNEITADNARWAGPRARSLRTVISLDSYYHDASQEKV